MFTATFVTERVTPGLVHIQSSVGYKSIQIGKSSRGGIINTISKNAFGMVPDEFLAQVEKWEGASVRWSQSLELSIGS